MAITVIPDRGPLRNFARSYHQDAHLIWPTFDAFVNEYLDRMDPKESRALAEELRQFLAKNYGAKGKGLRNAFARAGAGGALPPGEEFRCALERAQRIADAA